MGTRLRLLESFFDDASFDMIVGYTKCRLYGHRQKADASFEITNEKFRLFLYFYTNNV